MKILELCLSYGFGGLELYTVKTVNFLSQSNNNYKVFVKKNSFIDDKLTALNISPKYLDVKISAFPIIAAIKLAKYIEKSQIDIIHIHWRYDFLLAVLAKVFSKRAVKLVYTRQMALTRYKNDFYHRFLYRNVDKYLVITRDLYKQAIKYLPIEKSRVHVLYYGVPEANQEESCETFINKNKLSNQAFKLAIFGRVEYGKGQHLVVEAAKKLKEQGQEIQVAMIGHIMDKEYFKYLESEIEEHNLMNNIFYLGFHDNPTSIMSCFDAVVLATKCETFGLVLPEAMRSGVAVIGSNCGGVPEIIEHEKTGLLFETGNVEDLTLQLLKIVDDNDFCSRLAIAGKIDADERFSEEKHFKKLIEHFEIA